MLRKPIIYLKKSFKIFLLFSYFVIKKWTIFIIGF